VIGADEEQKLTRKLQQIHVEMDRLDDLDDQLMNKAYKNPAEAEDRMMVYREENGEQGLFVALRENPDQFGDYPDDKARFNDAYMARNELPVVFAQYKRLRDEADLIQTQLDRIRRERDDPMREDDEGHKR